MKKRKKYHYAFIFVFLFGILPFAFMYFMSKHKIYTETVSFIDCVNAGFPVTATYPEVCALPGKKFINPLQEATVSSPLSTDKSKEDADPKSQSYYVEGKMVKMIDGMGILPADPLKGSATSAVMVLDGATAFDINQDGVDDKVLLLVLKNNKEYYEYYITAMLSLHTGYTGANAIYLGQDIASTTVSFRNKELLVTYTKKQKKESLQMSTRIIYKDNLLQELPSTEATP